MRDFLESELPYNNTLENAQMSGKRYSSLQAIPKNKQIHGKGSEFEGLERNFLT